MIDWLKKILGLLHPYSHAQKPDKPVCECGSDAFDMNVEDDTNLWHRHAPEERP